MTIAVGILGNHPIILTSRGEAYLETGQHDAALADLNEALRLQPSHFFAYLFRGRAHKEKGQYDEAIADFDKALSLKPDDAVALENRKETYQAKGETPPSHPAPAESTLSHAANLPFQPAGITPMGQLDRNAALRELLLRGMPPLLRADPDRAIAEATTEIEAKPDAIAGYWKRAYGYVAKDDIDSAIKDYDAIIALDSGKAQFYLYRAVAHELQDRLYDALADFIAATRLEPAQIKTIITLVDDKIGFMVPGTEAGGVMVVSGSQQVMQLAICVKYYRERRYSEALINLNALIEAKPEYGDAYIIRGASLAATGDLDAAVANFQTAARLNRKQ